MGDSSPPGCTIRVRFHLPAPGLRDYFTSFYLTEITVAEGSRVTDYLHPEWANLRIVSGEAPEAEIAGVPVPPRTDALFVGPTSRSVRFTVGTTRVWGIGILPLGWARLIAASAADYVDRLVDPRDDPRLAAFRPLIATLFGDTPDEARELARIATHFSERLGYHLPDEERIVSCHRALIDPDVQSVADVAEAAGVPAHTLERLCRRCFGFPPSLLLRRQRFMRSLTQYMLDPTLKWIGAIDCAYHDQAQFVRDFHRFMGMSPSAYAALPHPVLGEVMRARHAVSGAAVQALDPPRKHDRGARSDRGLREAGDSR